VPPSSFGEEFQPVEFTDEERKAYQQILLNPAFQKALILVNNLRPSCFITGHEITTQKESRKLNQLKGWELYHAALMKVGMPEEEKKEYKQLKESWQDPDHNIIKPKPKPKPNKSE